jgi:hypothetical protein
MILRGYVRKNQQVQVGYLRIHKITKEAFTMIEDQTKLQ